MKEKNYEAALTIKEARLTIAFTGAGISVESGIPPFRGPGGLYERVSPSIFEIDSFLDDPAGSWKMLLEYVLLPLLRARPNPAHEVLARMEEKGLIKAVITQNIDGLHRRAGSRNVIEFHGTADELECLRCRTTYPAEKFLPVPLLKSSPGPVEKPEAQTGPLPGSDVSDLIRNFEPPRCPRCKSILKPAIVFFGERIPESALARSFDYARKTDCLLIIGTSGVVYPAAMIPQIAAANNAQIIEINTEPSEYTEAISSIFIQAKASEALAGIEHYLTG